MKRSKILMRKRKVLVIAIDILIIVAFIIGGGFIKFKEPIDSKATIIKREIDGEFDNGSKIKIDNLSKEQEQNLFKLCKVWGFAKYYHPSIAKGNVNWDYELFRVMPKILEEQSGEKVDKLLCEWIEKLGKVKEGKNQSKIDQIKLEPDIAWIKDSQFISSDLSELLSQIEKAKRTGANYYVRKAEGLGNVIFQNEKSYDYIDYKNDTGYELLSLFRYWNMVQYYFPYKNMMDQSWDAVLSEFIPKMVKCDSELNYNLTLYELMARTQDAQAFLFKEKPVVKTFFGEYFAPLELKLIDNKVVVFRKLKGLSNDTNIKEGDVILAIGGKKVEDLITEKAKYFPKVNKQAYNKELMNSLLRSNSKELELTIERDDKTIQEKIPCIDYSSSEGKKQNIESNTFINGSIAYIHVGNLSKGEVENLLIGYKGAKGLIIDLRTYPAVDIFPNLKKNIIRDSKVYAKIVEPYSKIPGEFLERNAKAIESDNKNGYNGKVVVIIDENTQGSSEFLTMLLKYGVDATVLGSNSAGAIGNAAEVVLPGGVRSYMSGVGLYNPEGADIQRVGIVPDVEIKPTIKGLRDGRDEIYDKAVYIINH